MTTSATHVLYDSIIHVFDLGRVEASDNVIVKQLNETPTNPLVVVLSRSSFYHASGLRMGASSNKFVTTLRRTSGFRNSLRVANIFVHKHTCSLTNSSAILWVFPANFPQPVVLVKRITGMDSPPPSASKSPTAVKNRT